MTESPYLLVRVSLTVEIIDPQWGEPVTSLTDKATLGGASRESAGLAAQNLVEALVSRQRKALDAGRSE